MSFKSRMSLLVAALLSTTVGVFTFVLIRAEEKSLAAALESRRRETAVALADVCRDALISEQFIFLSNYLRGLSQNPEVREATCLDMNGRAVGHSVPAKTFTILPPNALGDLLSVQGPVETETDADTLTVSVPVGAPGPHLGGARVLFSKAATDKRFRAGAAEARRRLLALAVLVLAGGAAAAFLMTAFALRPLGRLVEGVRAFAAGKLDHRIASPRKDEIGQLAGEFDKMADRLSELDQMKQDFVSGVTHDLKSPLSTVRLNLEVIDRESAARKLDFMAEPLFTSRRALDRLWHLITSLLDVAKIESALELNLKEISLEEMAERVVEAHRLIAGHKGISIDLVVENELAPLRADPVKMERVLSNLVGNAVKYTDKGSVRVTISGKEGRQDVRIADTGPGIPPDALKNLFTKFYRVAGGTRDKEGAGLGLSIVKALVEAHGGTVAAESVVGKGSVFTVSLKEFNPSSGPSAHLLPRGEGKI